MSVWFDSRKEDFRPILLPPGICRGMSEISGYVELKKQDILLGKKKDLLGKKKDLLGKSKNLVREKESLLQREKGLAQRQQMLDTKFASFPQDIDKDNIM